MMTQEFVQEKIVERFGPETILNAVDFRDQLTLTVPPEKIYEICAFLKESPELQFNLLSFVGGVDRLPLEPRFEIVYQLCSVRHNSRFRIKTQLAEPAEGLPVIDSVVSLWPTADWHERETAEMYGIIFRNHPDPRKLLLPENWKVHPLRKDFPLEGSPEETPDLPS